jgi:hypothetical protein
MPGLGGRPGMGGGPGGIQLPCCAMLLDFCSSQANAGPEKRGTSPGLQLETHLAAPLLFRRARYLDDRKVA